MSFLYICTSADACLALRANSLSQAICPQTICTRADKADAKATRYKHLMGRCKQSSKHPFIDQEESLISLCQPCQPTIIVEFQVPAQSEYDHGEEEVKCENHEESVCKTVSKQICHTEITKEEEPYTVTEQKCEQVPHEVRHFKNRQFTNY